VADIRKPWHVLGRDFMISVTSLAYPVDCVDEYCIRMSKKIRNRSSKKQGFN
jgi:hypothetical protein